MQTLKTMICGKFIDSCTIKNYINYVIIYVVGFKYANMIENSTSVPLLCHCNVNISYKKDELISAKSSGLFVFFICVFVPFT